MTSPRIGVLCNQQDGDGGTFSQRQIVNQSYLQCLESVGATPLLIPHLADERVLELLELCHGLLVTGGADFDPRSYGRPPHAGLGSVVPRRDHLDRVAIGELLQRPEMPMLGICRGIQAINVVAGGTLIQDVPSEVPGALKHSQSAPGWYGTHDIDIAEDSILAEILGARRVAVNSYHHQAVDDVAPGFRAVAHSGDGVVEAIERSDAAFCLGLQCHPELMAPRDGRFMRIFSDFVDACR